jgi:hypothetical protein
LRKCVKNRSCQGVSSLSAEVQKTSDLRLALHSQGLSTAMSKIFRAFCSNAG